MKVQFYLFLGEKNQQMIPNSKDMATTALITKGFPGAGKEQTKPWQQPCSPTWQSWDSILCPIFISGLPNSLGGAREQRIGRCKGCLCHAVLSSPFVWGKWEKCPGPYSGDGQVLAQLGVLCALTGATGSLVRALRSHLHCLDGPAPASLLITSI